MRVRVRVWVRVRGGRLDREHLLLVAEEVEARLVRVGVRIRVG